MTDLFVDDVVGDERGGVGRAGVHGVGGLVVEGLHLRRVRHVVHVLLHVFLPVQDVGQVRLHVVHCEREKSE